jgi:nitroreductase
MSSQSAEAVYAVIEQRRSTRAFLPQQVARPLIDEILTVASHAPSGANAQPWRVHVLTGNSLQRVTKSVQAVFDDPDLKRSHREEFDYYPSEWVDPFKARRRRNGWDLYGLLGIGREDKAEMRAHQRRNYEFFGAPVGLIFTIDRIMGLGSLMDYGMFLQNIMIAAQARGLNTCPMAAFNVFHEVVRDELSLADSEQVLCGMALGYGDSESTVNQLVNPRADLSEFVMHHD